MNPSHRPPRRRPATPFLTLNLRPAVRAAALALAAVLVLGTAAALLAPLSTWLPGGGRHPPPDDGDRGPASPPGGGDRVAPGVRLWDHDLSGWTRAQVAEWLTALAPGLRRDPVPARIDPVTRGVIPELAGARLDVAATLEAVLAAPAGTAVDPRFDWIEPEVTMADFPLAPVYQGNPQRRQVTLMINVAWGNEELAQMLDILDAEGVRTTFFLVGRWAERYPDLARAVAERGHEIASHGYSDAAAIGSLDYQAARADLERAHRVITEVTGREPRWFSPHRGEWSPALLEACRDLGYRLFLWTVDTIDWQDPDRGTLLARVLDRAVPGALVLMHPRPVTVDALPDMIRGLRRHGLEPVPLGTLLDPHLPPDPAETGLPGGATAQRAGPPDPRTGDAWWGARVP